MLIKNNKNIFNDVTTTGEYIFGIYADTLMLQISGENITCNIEVFGTTEEDINYCKLSCIDELNINILTKIITKGIYTIDVTGFRYIKILVNSTNSAISCNAVEVVEQ